MALHFGHAPLSTIKLLHLEINISHVEQQFFYTVCAATCQHRHNFHSSTTKTTFAFEWLHIDTWGAYSHPTYNGCTLFLSIVNDYTKLLGFIS